jgi:hypothetical protein
VHENSVRKTQDLATHLYLERCELSEQTGLALKWEEVEMFEKQD